MTKKQENDIKALQAAIESAKKWPKSVKCGLTFVRGKHKADSCDMSLNSPEDILKYG